MTDEKATKKQQELLQFIGDFLKEHDYAPSYREIMGALGYKSVSTVAVHVDGLIAKGYLTKSDKSARSVRLATRQATEYGGHIAWLRAEIHKCEAAGAEKEALILKQALAIVEA